MNHVDIKIAKEPIYQKQDDGKYIVLVGIRFDNDDFYLELPAALEICEKLLHCCNIALKDNTNESSL